MNIDIHRDIAVGFDRDGNPVNRWGEKFPSSGKKGLWMAKELLDGLNRARKLIEPNER